VSEAWPARFRKVSVTLDRILFDADFPHASSPSFSSWYSQSCGQAVDVVRWYSRPLCIATFLSGTTTRYQRELRSCAKSAARRDDPSLTRSQRNKKEVWNTFRSFPSSTTMADITRLNVCCALGCIRKCIDWWQGCSRLRMPSPPEIDVQVWSTVPSYRLILSLSRHSYADRKSSDEFTRVILSW